MSRKDNKSSILYWMYVNLAFLLKSIGLLLIGYSLGAELEIMLYALGAAVFILILKARLIYKFESGEAFNREGRKWLMELSILLAIAALNHLHKPVFFALYAVMAAVLVITFVILVVINLIHYTERGD